MRKLVLLLNLFFLISFCLPCNVATARLSSVDKDGDGWPDVYEEKLGADPADAGVIPNSLEDPDQDGLNNEAERDAGTDPISPDTDGDGLSDAQEIVGYNSDPFCRDTDKDGSSDLDEAIAGTDPRHPDTDGDGWLDGAERLSGSDPCDSTSTPKSP